MLFEKGDCVTFEQDFPMPRNFEGIADLPCFEKIIKIPFRVLANFHIRAVITTVFAFKFILVRITKRRKNRAIKISTETRK